jgi:dsRNA-specific ribonuclease
MRTTRLLSVRVRSFATGAEARKRAAVLCDRFRWSLTYTEKQLGPPHAPVFEVRCCIAELGGAPVVESGLCVSATKRAAQELAVADALRLLDSARRDSPLFEDQRLDAWLGDVALDFTLALLGRRAGLSSEALDSVRQRLLNNESLAACAAVQLSSETATATSVEAAVGAAVTDEAADALLAVLLPALRSTPMPLLQRLEEAIREEAEKS